MTEDPMERAVRRLTAVSGVRGAMVVDTEAGVPVVSELRPGVNETALAAMAGALYTRTSDVSRGAAMGQLRVAQLEAEDGHVVMAGSGPLLLVVLAEREAQLGLVRVQVKRAAREVEG